MQSFFIDKIRYFKKNFDVYNHIYLSKSALIYNLSILKNITKKEVIPVLKSNAYGHGIEQIASILNSEDVPYIAVDGYYEALKIRNKTNHKILVMGSIKPDNFSVINPKKYTFVVQDLETIKAIARTNKVFNIHIELETGMNRHGVKPIELDSILACAKKYKRINIDGVMSHLADSDNPNTDEFVKHQCRVFDQCVETIVSAGYSPKYIHVAQSAGSIKAKSKYANAIRSGLALYGISPLLSSDTKSNTLSKLRPVLKLTSTVSKIQHLNPGETVSYNRTFEAKTNSKVGILPIGYYEGIPRALSNSGLAEYKNRYIPIVGKICMNHTMIDLSGTNIAVNDEITLISNNANSRVSVINICLDNKLFCYSLLCGLNSNIRKTIID